MILESSTISEKQKQNAQSNDKEIYFIILNSSEEKLNFRDLKFLSEIEPEIIYNNSIEKGKGFFVFHNVFKLDIKTN